MSDETTVVVSDEPTVVIVDEGTVEVAQTDVQAVTLVAVGDGDDTHVEVEPTASSTSVTSPAGTTEVVTSHEGPPGPAGPAGVGSGYIHDQATPADVWVIAHGLNTWPSVVVVDSSGRQVEGDVTYIDANSLEVRFAAPFGGTAYLT